MPIDAVARHTGLSWHSVKALDAASLTETVVPPRPALLSGIRYLGVDEVARAKGHDYVTLVYDLTPGEHCGRILWVKEGRDAATLLEFLDALSQECADGIEAVAIDMGLACLDLQEVVPDKQQIMSSRSFGTLVYDLPDLEEAVASYIAKAAEKLRGQDSLAGAVQVYIRTNVFKPDAPQYQKGITLPLPEATSDTRVLTLWAIRILRRIYRPGFGYHKAGVMLLELIPAGNRQFALFDTRGGAGDARSEKLMGVLDGINQRYGRGALRLAAEGVERSWQMRRGNLSPAYMTSWDELPVVMAK